VRRSVGFDHVIDYSQEDVTRTGLSYDVILDVKTNRSPFDYARALKPHGTYVTVGGSMPRLIQCLIFDDGPPEPAIATFVFWV